MLKGSSSFKIDAQCMSKVVVTNKAVCSALSQIEGQHDDEGERSGL